MKMVDAERLNAAMCVVFFTHKDGAPLTGTDVDLILGASLADMVEAARMVRARGLVRNPHGGGTITSTPDDRLVAAIYTLTHYNTSQSAVLTITNTRGVSKALRVVSCKSMEGALLQGEKDVRDHLLAIDVPALIAEVEQLREVLAECAQDLRCEIEARASGELPRRIERDMKVVKRAEALLAATMTIEKEQER